MKRKTQCLHGVSKQPAVDYINGNENIKKNTVSDCAGHDYSLHGLFVPCIFPSTYLCLDHIPAHFLWNGKQGWQEKENVINFKSVFLAAWEHWRK